MIRNEMLPAYNLRDSLRIAIGELWGTLLRSGIAIFALLGLVLMILVTLAEKGHISLFTWMAFSLTPSALLALLFLSLFLRVVWGLWPRTLGNKVQRLFLACGEAMSTWVMLLLPRVTGGLFVGFFALCLAEEPWRLVDYALHVPSFWLPLWTFAGLVVGGYFFGEAHAAIGDGWESAKRAFWTLMWTAAQSLIVGSLFALFTYPIWSSIPNESHQQLVQDLFSQWQYRVATVLTFAPLAILVGLIFQVLWEDKPVTTSIWPTESR